MQQLRSIESQSISGCEQGESQSADQEFLELVEKYNQSVKTLRQLSQHVYSGMERFAGVMPTPRDRG